MVKFILLFLFISNTYLSCAEFHENDPTKKRSYVESSEIESSKKQKITTEKVFKDSETPTSLTLSPQSIDVDYTLLPPLVYTSPPSSDHDSSPISNVDSSPQFIAQTSALIEDSSTFFQYGKITPALIILLNLDESLIKESDDFVTSLAKVKQYISKNRIYTKLKSISEQFDKISRDNASVLEEELNKLRLEFREKPKDEKHKQYTISKWRIIEDWNFEKWPHQSNIQALLGYLFFPKELEHNYITDESICTQVGPQISLAFSAKYGNPLAFYCLYLTLKPGWEYKYTENKEDLAKKQRLKDIAVLPKNKAKEYLNKDYSDKQDFIYEYLLLKNALAKKDICYTKKWDEELVISLALGESEDPRAIKIYADAISDNNIVDIWLQKAYDLGYKNEIVDKNAASRWQKAYDLGYKKAAYNLCYLIFQNNIIEGFKAYLNCAIQDDLALAYREVGYRLEFSNNIINYKNYPELQKSEELVSIMGELRAIIVKQFELAGDKGDMYSYNKAVEFIKDCTFLNSHINITEEQKTILYDKIKDLYKKEGEWGYGGGYYNLATTLRNENKHAEATECDIKAIYYTNYVLDDIYKSNYCIIPIPPLIKDFYDNTYKYLLCIANLLEG